MRSHNDFRPPHARASSGPETEFAGNALHSAFQGQTPDEMYFGTGDQVPEELEALRAEARAERLAKNRSVACDAGQT